MNWILLVRPEAEQDMISACHWYNQKRACLGLEFSDAVVMAMQELASSPEHHRLYYRNFRRILLPRFPSKIFYQIIGTRVVVFRVLYAKQSHQAMGET